VRGVPGRTRRPDAADRHSIAVSARRADSKHSNLTAALTQHHSFPAAKGRSGTEGMLPRRSQGHPAVAAYRGLQRPCADDFCTTGIKAATGTGSRLAASRPATQPDPRARHGTGGQGRHRRHRADDAGAAAPTGPAPDGAPCPCRQPDDAADKTRKGPEHRGDAEIFSPVLWTAKAASHNTVGLERWLRRPGAQIAQLVEQRTENPRVGGSIPSLGTNTFKHLRGS
jgi:hypothetical protein